MNDFARLISTPDGMPLGPVKAIPDGGARDYVLELPHGRFHGFIVRRGRDLRGYVDRCPHAFVPLGRSVEDYVTPEGDLIACSWHGARFSIEEGYCVRGPCRGQSLIRWPVTASRGTVVTGSTPPPGLFERLRACFMPHD